MHVLLPTLGSAGDVHPAIALGLALQERGHRATVVTNPLFADAVRSTGLEFIALGTAAELRATLADPRLWHPVKAFECIAQSVLLPNLSRLYEIVRSLASSDMVVAAPATCLGARMAQERLGVAVATVHLQPALIRSLIDSGRQGRITMGPRMPRVLKRSLFTLMDRFFVNPQLLSGLNTYRAGLGLPPLAEVFGHYLHSPQLVIGLFPEWLAAPQADWPPNTHLTGFPLFDGSGGREIDPEAEEFFSAGPPPVLFTAGSATLGQEKFFAESVEACRMSGLRGLFVTNFSEQLPSSLPPPVRAFPYLPFSKALKRCSALVYHGGIGTLAHAIQAGIPHLVVPNAHDQPDNAHRIERLGLGKSIFPERYKLKAVAPMLTELTSSSELKQRCQKFAQQVDSPNSKEALQEHSGPLSDLGISLSAEEIDQTQRDMWKNFPREDT